MLGPIGSDVMLIFRLLSPDEIDRYIVEESVDRVEGTKTAGGEDILFDKHPPQSGDPRSKKKFDKGAQAEIIPLDEFREKSDSQAEKESQDDQNSHEPRGQEQEVKVHGHEDLRSVGSSGSENSELASVGILSSSRIREIEAERIRNANKNKDSTTVFLIKEREKMRQSKKRLIEQSAIRQYQVNASQEFYQPTDEDLLDEEDDSENKGILVNKRQY